MAKNSIYRGKKRESKRKGNPSTTTFGWNTNTSEMDMNATNPMADSSLKSRSVKSKK
jgi:hypothetical protein